MGATGAGGIQRALPLDVERRVLSLVDFRNWPEDRGTKKAESKLAGGSRDELCSREFSPSSKQAGSDKQQKSFDAWEIKTKSEGVS